MIIIPIQSFHAYDSNKLNKLRLLYDDYQSTTTTTDTDTDTDNMIMMMTNSSNDDNIYNQTIPITSSSITTTTTSTITDSSSITSPTNTTTTITSITTTITTTVVANDNNNISSSNISSSSRCQSYHMGTRIFSHDFITELSLWPNLMSHSDKVYGESLYGSRQGKGFDLVVCEK